MAEPPEKNEHLLLLTAGPVLWAAHFLACYLTAAVWCAKAAGRGGDLGPVPLAIAAFTVLALVGIGLVGRAGRRRHGYGTATLPHDFDSPADRHRFLGFATLLLAGLSAVAVVYSALTVVFIRACH